ncbi:MAG TPA: chemotaxis protein CheW, partial [Spirochaetota bacterium]|nr:chemotaxis protein CheW [Spirochaetota bacterium]
MNINELTQMVNRVTAATSAEAGDTAVSENEIVQIVSFMLDDVEYGINILQVHEIIRMPEITRLPNTAEYIRGVINLRGSVIPVVDVRLRFGLASGDGR